MMFWGCVGGSSIEFQSKMLARSLNMHLIKEESFLANKLMKRSSTLLGIKGMKMKPTMRYHDTSFRYHNTPIRYHYTPVRYHYTPVRSVKM